MIVANDLPAWLLQTFERIDYGRLGIMGGMFVSQLSAFCQRYPRKTSDYKAHERRSDIPQNVLDILNAIDYGAIDADTMKAMRTAIPTYLGQHLAFAMKK